MAEKDYIDRIPILDDLSARNMRGQNKLNMCVTLSLMRCIKCGKRLMPVHHREGGVPE